MQFDAPRAGVTFEEWMLGRMTQETASHLPAVFWRYVTDVACAEVEAAVGKPVFPFLGEEFIATGRGRAFRQEQFIFLELARRRQKALAAVPGEGSG